jgi:hypothetical protein
MSSKNSSSRADSTVSPDQDLKGGKNRSSSRAELTLSPDQDLNEVFFGILRLELADMEKSSSLKLTRETKKLLLKAMQAVLSGSMTKFNSTEELAARELIATLDMDKSIPQSPSSPPSQSANRSKSAVPSISESVGSTPSPSTVSAYAALANPFYTSSCAKADDTKAEENETSNNP